MPLSPGDKLGPYEILDLIGKGGMGEVYRAHDDRLRRDVAIKVSNSQFTERFTREARTVASLNHTNIAHLYDVGPNYLVMELVEGEDLKGPMAFDDALPIIQQLIDGIEAAHEKGIVHRDLKPANIKITPEGVVKILDFGLAKAMDPAPLSGSNAENSPTLTIGATAVGTILGTAGYMAPEQAKGKQADKRSDIWSFGVILFELLTGKKMFPGETAVEILGGVLNKEPDISAAPARVHRLLRWCLEPEKGIVNETRGEPAVSPDGRRVAFSARVDGKYLLWVRDLDSLQTRMLPGTENPDNPFWAPDSRQVAFGSGGKLMKIDVTGGPATTVTATAPTRGGTWNQDDVILFATTSSGLLRVPAAGGTPTPVTELDKSRNETNHFAPQFLPDGHHFLYLAMSSNPEKSALLVGDLQTKDKHLILPLDRRAVYVDPSGGARAGYLLFVRERTLMAQAFDPGKLETTGAAVPIAEKVDVPPGNYAYFSASREGTLVYTSGGIGSALQLTWYDRSGKVAGTLGKPVDVQAPRVSPNGKMGSGGRHRGCRGERGRPIAVRRSADFVFRFALACRLERLRSAAGGIQGRDTILLASGSRAACFGLHPHQDRLDELSDRNLYRAS